MELRKLTKEDLKAFDQEKVSVVMQWVAGRLMGNLYVTSRLERDQTLLLFPPSMQNTACLKTLTMNYVACLCLEQTFIK